MSSLIVSAGIVREDANVKTWESGLKEEDEGIEYVTVGECPVGGSYLFSFLRCNDRISTSDFGHT